MQFVESQKRESKLQSDVKSAKKQLSDAGAEIQSLADQNRQLSEQLSAAIEKAGEFSRQSKSLTKSVDDQKLRLREASEQLESLDRKLTKTEQRLREVEATNAEQAAALSAKEETVQSLERSTQELLQANARLTEFRESVQSLIPGSAGSEILRVIGRALQGSEVAAALLEKLSSSGREDALSKIAQLKANSETLRKIEGILPVSDDSLPP